MTISSRKPIFRPLRLSQRYNLFKPLDQSTLQSNDAISILPEMARVGSNGHETRARSRTETLGPALEPAVTSEGIFATVDTYARIRRKLLKLHAR